MSRVQPAREEFLALPGSARLRRALSLGAGWGMKLSLVGLLIARLLRSPIDLPFCAMVAVAILITITPSLLERNLGRQLPLELDFLVTFALYLDVFWGEGQRWYDSVYGFDWITHALGSAVVSLIGWMFAYSLNHVRRIRLTVWFLALATFCFGVTLGVLFEIFEFALDRVWGYRSQRSLENTMWDLIFNLVGALLVALLGAWHFKYRDRIARRWIAAPIARLMGWRAGKRRRRR